ncbi:MAG: electron transport complex subunit RsxA [Tissierellia bacterium]|jgi:electron transport complex protein RnfA|nr:electron transport complex subunit RsxA [Bacillota bacterium]NLL23722.1 electron transport complex subunit RsxA [Tissierellia bacterium]
MENASILTIVISAILVNNFVLSRFLGICSFIGISQKVETALGLGLADIFVMAMASVFAYFAEVYILEYFNIQYLRVVMYILIIASLVQFVEIVLKKVLPSLYQALGIFLPLITTNCAVLGVALLNVQYSFNLVQSVVHSVAAAVGFTMAIVIFAFIREKMESNDVPQAFKGFPIALITASLLSFAFLGFQGMI